MKPVRKITGTALPLDRSDVDTDQIIPSDWLKRVERTGFEQGLFSEWREDPAFVLNDPRFAGARILVAGPNFGTGSSREHAVWAIQQYGFEAVISPRFGDIFRNNATKNGLVPVQVGDEVARSLLDRVADDPSIEITVDVEQLTVSAPDRRCERRLPPRRRRSTPPAGGSRRHRPHPGPLRRHRLLRDHPPRLDAVFGLDWPNQAFNFSCWEPSSGAPTSYGHDEAANKLVKKISRCGRAGSRPGARWRGLLV